MNPVINQNPNQNVTGDSFWDQFSHIPGTIETHIPTFDKSLDSYFDRNFAAIIEEWDLLTASDLQEMENRLNQVTAEINNLYAGKVSLEARTAKLDDLISQMERSI